VPQPSSPDIPPVQEGDILDGKYRVDKVLGAGGMGIVVAATHVHLNTRVAIKFLLPAAMGSPQVIERFAREARSAVQIQSEHVARVTDVGSLPTGSPYMVMEYLEGSDLADAIERTGPIPIPQAVGYVLQACEAIAEAHSLGIIHRDLKPANLFLARRAGRDPMVKVLDFGISKTKEAGAGLTQTASVMGSPYYMAPEQMMSSKDVDARSDIWALGIILYELLTGKAPFQGDTMAAIVFQVTQRDAGPLREKRPDVPEGLAAVVDTCLRRDPAQRYENVARFASALVPYGPPRSDISLERISRVLGASMRPPSVAEPAERSSNPMRATSSTWASSQSGTARPNGAQKAVLGAVGALVLLIGVGVAWRATHSGDASKGQDLSTTTSAATPGPSTTGAASAPVVAPPQAALAPLPEIAAPMPVAAPAASTASKPARGGRPSPSQKPSPAAPVAAAPAAAPPPAPAPAPAPPPPSRGGGLNMGMKE
jgi:serine/threonine-protein kinase